MAQGLGECHRDRTAAKKKAGVLGPGSPDSLLFRKVSRGQIAKLTRPGMRGRDPLGGRWRRRVSASVCTSGLSRTRLYV